MAQVGPAVPGGWRGGSHPPFQPPQRLPRIHRSAFGKVASLCGAGQRASTWASLPSDETDPAIQLPPELSLGRPAVREIDPDGRLAAEYGLVGIPSTLVIGGNGRVAYRFLGKVDAAVLRAALDLVLGAEEPRAPTP